MWPARSASTSRGPLGERTWTLRVPARSSRAKIGASRRLSASKANTWPRLASSAASASVLPPPPAQRSSTCSPGLAPASSAASWEPSSWISIWPLRKAGSACTAGLLPSAATSMRRPSGDHRVSATPKWASAAAASARSVLRRLTRRSSGARAASALRLLDALLAERLGERCVQPFRIVAGDPGRRAIEAGGGKRARAPRR